MLQRLLNWFRRHGTTNTPGRRPAKGPVYVEPQLTVEIEGGAEVGISPDGRAFATFAHTTIGIWDADKQVRVCEVEARAPTWCVAFSRNHKFIITGHENGDVRLRDTATGLEKIAFVGHTDAVFDAAFSPDNQLLATTSRDGTIRLWHTKTGEQALCLQSKGECRGPVGRRAVAFFPNGKAIVTSEYGYQLPTRIWDITTGRHIKDLEFPTGAMCLAISDGGRHLVTGDQEESVTVWELPSGTRIVSLGRFPGSIGGVSISPTGKRIIVGVMNGEAAVFDVLTGQCLFKMLTTLERFGSISVSAGSRRIAILARHSDNDTVKVWDGDAVYQLEKGTS